MRVIMLKDFDSHAPTDFDFIIGDWTVQHRKLKNILNGCNEWIEFDGDSSTRKILGGFGNLEDNHLHFPDSSVRAVAMRSYNEILKHWSIWWLDRRSPDTLDVPVVGRFENGFGVFYAEDIYQDIPIKVRFKWNSLDPKTPKWEQAFSKDGGQTWEVNWTMEFTKV